ncbi:hypothetical protein GmHk_16G046537 [Glycine max]|nr:hypothetical protein GmHk_16G046537 [Glycine max]
MEGVVDVVYYDGDVVSSCEGVLFECPDSPKEIKIKFSSKEEILILLRKPRKPRSSEEIIVLMCGSMATKNSNEDDKPK